MISKTPIHLLLTASLLAPAPFAQEPETAEAAAAKTPAPVHLIKLKGAYADLAEQGGDLTSLLLGGGVGKPKPFYDLIDQLDALGKKDGDTVLLDLTTNFAINPVQMAELERAMSGLRKSGKKCYAYIEGAGPTTYQVASMCDEIMMADLGSIDLPSAAMSVTFMKDALDLLGVKFDVVRCGDFKGAVEPYVLSKMSKHLRAHYLAMLEKINNDMARRIATGRRIGITQVREMQSQRLISARDAKEAGLVDRIVQWRGAEDALAIALGNEDFELKNALRDKKKRKSFNPMSFFAEMFRKQDEKEVEDESLVVLHLSGQIVDGDKPVPGSMVSGPSVKTIQSLTENENVKGVVVRINSPGGSATASEAIMLALQDLAAEKPVVVSMGRLAASGGYYITCLGRPILAEAATITGSIGVFGMKPSLGPLMRRVGIHNEMITLDDSAGMMAMDQSWNDEQKATMQRHVNHIYDVFIGHVSRSRNMASSDVLAIAGGRVWSGEQAVENKLVDRIGGLHDAVAMVADEAGISDYEIEHMPRPKSFMDTFAEELLNIRAGIAGKIESAALKRLNLDSALRVLLDAIQNESPTRVWALMPTTVDIR